MNEFNIFENKDGITSSALNGDTGIFKIFRQNKTLLWGAASLLLAILAILLGVFTYLSADLVAVLFEEKSTHIWMLWGIFATIAIVLSVLFTVFSIVYYKRASKKTFDYIGFVLSMLSCALNTMCIAGCIINFI